jgi:virulence-associated protein VagC
MKTPVTEQGVTIPKDWFNGVKTVEIQRRGHAIVITPAVADDPILSLGSNPITLPETDASENHDGHLYGR